MACFQIDAPMTCSVCGKVANVAVKVNGDPAMSAKAREALGALMVLAYEHEHGPPLCNACMEAQHG